MKDPGIGTFINFEDYKNLLFKTSLPSKTDLLIRKEVKVFVFLKDDVTAWRVTPNNIQQYHQAISRLKQLPHSGATTESTNSDVITLYAYLEDITHFVKRELQYKDAISEIKKKYPPTTYGYFVFISAETDPKKVEENNVNAENYGNPVISFLEMNYKDNYLYTKEDVGILGYEPANLNSISLSVGYLAIAKQIIIPKDVKIQELKKEIDEILQEHPNWKFFVFTNTNSIVFGIDITALVHSEIISEKDSDINTVLINLSSRIKTLLNSDMYQILYIFPYKLLNEDFLNSAQYMQREYLEGESLPDDPFSPLSENKSKSKSKSKHENKPIQSYTEIASLGSSVAIITTDVYNNPPFYKQYNIGGVTRKSDNIYQKNGLWYVRHMNLISPPLGCANGWQFASVITGGTQIASCSSGSYSNYRKNRQPPHPYHPEPLRCKLNIKALPFRRVAISFSSNYFDGVAKYISIDKGRFVYQTGYIVLNFYEDGHHIVDGILYSRFGSCKVSKRFYVSEQRIAGDITVSDTDLFYGYYINIYPTKDMALDKNYVIFSVDENDEEDGGI